MIQSESIQSLKDDIERLKGDIAAAFGGVASPSVGLKEKRQKIHGIVALIGSEPNILKPAPLQSLLSGLQKIFYDRAAALKLKNELQLLVDALVKTSVSNGKVKERLFAWSWDLLMSRTNPILFYLVKSLLVEDAQNRLLRPIIPNFTSNLLSLGTVSDDILDLWDAIRLQYPSTFEVFLSKLAIYCLESEYSDWLWRPELIPSWKANNLAAATELYDIVFVKLRLYAADTSRLAPYVNALERLARFDASQMNNVLNAIAALKQASSSVISESIMLLCNRFWSPAKRQVITTILQTQLSLLLETSDAPSAIKALLLLNEEILKDDWVKAVHAPLLALRCQLILKKQTTEVDELMNKINLNETIENEASALFSRLVPPSDAKNLPVADYVSESEMIPVLTHDLKFMPSSFTTEILDSQESVKRCLEIWWSCFDIAKDPQLSQEVLDSVIDEETESKKLIRLFKYTKSPERILQKMIGIVDLPAEQISELLQYPLSLETIASLNNDLKLLAYHENHEIRRASLKLLFSNPKFDRTRPIVTHPIVSFNPKDKISLLEAFESSRMLVDDFLCIGNSKPSETLQSLSEHLAFDDGYLSYFITLMVQRIRGLVDYESINDKDSELRQFYPKHFASFGAWYESIRKMLFAKLVNARCFGFAYYHIREAGFDDYVNCKAEVLEMMKWASMTKQDGLLNRLRGIFGNIVIEDCEIDNERLLNLVSNGIDPLGEHPLILARLQDPGLENLDIDDVLTPDFKKALDMLAGPPKQFDPSGISNEIWACLWPQLSCLPDHLLRIAPRLRVQFPEYFPNEETKEFYRCLSEQVAQTWEEMWLKCFTKIVDKMEGQLAPSDLLTEARELFSETLAQRSRPKSPHESNFAAKFGIVIHKLLQAKDPMPLLKDFKKVASNLGVMVKEEGLKVSKLCPRLKDLARSGKVVLPGTFSFVLGKLVYSGPKRVFGIDESIIRLPSKSMPKKVKLILDSQKSVEYLLKSGPEIVVEERINQLAWLLNDPNVHPLQMIRLQADSWLIEWITNSVSCFQVVGKYNPIVGSLDFSVNTFKAHLEKEAHLGRSRLASFQSFQSQVPIDLLLNYCLGKGTSSILEVQESMAHSIGALSAFCYLLGIGDRHLDNILIDANGQKMYYVDLGLCFGEGTRLAIPECVPFRLTKAFAALTGHCDGQFKSSFSALLNRWRSLLPEIKALLDFWIRYPAGKFKGKTVVINEEDCEEEVLMPRSLSLIFSGLVDEALARGSSNGIVFEGVKYHNDNELVDTLMKAASEETRLSRMYAGWMSWI